MNSPFPYYINHLIIAVAISAAAWFAGLTPILAGAAFYLGREIRDREKLGFWDWRGLLFPVVPLVVAEILWHSLKLTGG